MMLVKCDDFIEYSVHDIQYQQSNMSTHPDFILHWDLWYYIFIVFALCACIFTYLFQITK